MGGEGGGGGGGGDTTDVLPCVGTKGIPRSTWTKGRHGRHGENF